MILLRRGVLTRFLLLGCEDFAYIAVKAISENEWLVQEMGFLIALLILMLVKQKHPGRYQPFYLRALNDEWNGSFKDVSERGRLIRKSQNSPHHI